MHFIPDSLTYSVPLFLKRQCDRTLGALGEVKRGTYQGAPVALKGLFLLRTDAASTAAFGGAIPEAQRRDYVAKFMAECRFMQQCTHANIVPFYAGLLTQGVPGVPQDPSHPLPDPGRPLRTH